MPYEIESFKKIEDVLGSESKWYLLEEFYTLCLSFKLQNGENISENLAKIQIEVFFDIQTRFDEKNSYICTNFGVWKHLINIENLQNEKKLYEILMNLYNRKDILDQNSFENYFQLNWQSEQS